MTEQSGEEWLLGHIKKAKRGRTNEQIEKDVEALIEEVKTWPTSPIYFDPNEGWVVPTPREVSDGYKHRAARIIVSDNYTGHLN